MKNSIKKITSPLETEIALLKTIAQELPISARERNFSSSSSGVAEIDELNKSINTLLRQIAIQEEHIAQINFDHGRLKTAEQVAHSIKGVIATLQLKTSSLTQLSDKEKSELSSAISALRDISVNLLREKSEALSSDGKEQEAVHVLPLLTTVAAAKTSQYAKDGLSIRLDNELSFFGAFCSLDSGSLQSVLASLIDNSVEAGGTLIEIVPTRNESLLGLTISDNGKGIPAEVLPKLMQEGATFGKKDGNGIGLFHARETLGRVGGQIEITSIEGKGTKVHLSVPLASAPSGFAERLEVHPGATLVMVDDDPLIHQAMDQKIRSAPVERIVHLSSVSQFEKWLAENGPGELGSRIYLFDYDLKDRSSNGLDLIERYGLAFESVLVSGMTDDPSIRGRIVKLGVKWLPKDFLAQISFLDLRGTPKAASFLGAV